MKNHKLPYCIYVLLSQKDDQFYVGFSTNLKQRLSDHFNGRSQATELRRPFILIFCEYYLSKRDALNRERYFKTTIGKRMLRLIIKESLKEARNF